MLLKEEATPLADRVRLKEALAIFEEMLMTMDSMPAITDDRCAEGRAMRKIKHKAQLCLLKAWKLGDL